MLAIVNQLALLPTPHKRLCHYEKTIFWFLFCQEEESEDADEEEANVADEKTEKNTKQEKDIQQEGSKIHGQKTDEMKEKPNVIEQRSS